MLEYIIGVLVVAASFDAFMQLVEWFIDKIFDFYVYLEKKWKL